MTTITTIATLALLFYIAQRAGLTIEQIDRACGWILKKLLLGLRWVSVRIVYAFLCWVGTGIQKTIENLWLKFIEALANAIGKVIGYAIAVFVVFAFTLLWQANAYSLTKTFSYEGLKTLWETIK